MDNINIIVLMGLENNIIIKVIKNCLTYFYKKLIK